MLESGYNSHKYGGTSVVQAQVLNKFPSSLANTVSDMPAPAPYNRLVSSPEPGVTLVEPLEIAKATCAIAIHARYCAVTGFAADHVSIIKQDSYYTAKIKLDLLEPVCGKGLFVGAGSLCMVGRQVSACDTFRIYQLENAEFVRL